MDLCSNSDKDFIKVIDPADKAEEKHLQKEIFLQFSNYGSLVLDCDLVTVESRGLNTCVGVAARQYDIVPLITLSSDLDHRTPDLSSSTLILTPGLVSSEYSKVCLLLRSLVTKQSKPPSVSLT